MTKQDISPEELYMQELGTEAAFLADAEREEHAQMVSELLGDVATKEANLATYNKYIAIARGEYNPEKEKKKPEVEINFGKIGWITENETKKVTTEKVKAGDLEYLFVDLTPMNRTTVGLMEHLEKEGVANHLMETLKEKLIPELDIDVRHGTGKLRPVSIGGRNPKDVKPERSLNTSYPAYKIDAEGTNNRAIILMLGEHEGQPVFGLGALYDHADDGVVHKNLFLKQAS